MTFGDLNHRLKRKIFSGITSVFRFSFLLTTLLDAFFFMRNYDKIMHYLLPIKSLLDHVNLAIAGNKDDKLFQDGKTYTLTVPKDVPINRF